MSTLVFLDTGPLGMVTNPRATPQTERCTQWMEGLLTRGVRVLIPEIADYELRRELLRAEKIEGLRRLDALVEALLGRRHQLSNLVPGKGSFYG